jgi:hypothetical protein
MSATHALRAAIRAIRKVHDEQVLMWKVFYRTQVRPGGEDQPAPPADRASSAVKPGPGERELAGRR